MLTIFIVPAVVISWVVPSKNLSLTAGVMQAFDGFFNHFNIGFLTPILGVMLVAAALGGMLTWLAGPSKGLPRRRAEGDRAGHRHLLPR
ncbi:hypothetical protein [Nocardia tengchongensis]